MRARKGSLGGLHEGTQLCVVQRNAAEMGYPRVEQRSYENDKGRYIYMGRDEKSYRVDERKGRYGNDGGSRRSGVLRRLLSDQTGGRFKQEGPLERVTQKQNSAYSNRKE